MKDVKNVLATFGLLWLFMVCAVGTCSIFKTCKSTYNKIPHKGNIDIDSLITANDSVKLEVKSLDSIKNAKVIEVVSLDNDSTIKLFYELVSE